MVTGTEIRELRWARQTRGAQSGTVTKPPGMTSPLPPKDEPGTRAVNVKTMR